VDTKKISEDLKDYQPDQVNNYCAYLYGLSIAKNKDKTPKNPWMQHKTDEYLARMFKTVAMDGLVFDGQDITLQSTGVSYNFQAFKNLMFLAYPESIIDVSLVHKGDSFNFSKNSGQVNYSHVIENPFGQKEEDVVGAYCVIKNKRGQFLTLLSKADIDKHRKVAKTDYIWKQWFHEMALKTVIKKACKQHFRDTYKNVETLDNENYDLEKLVEMISKEQVQEIKDLIKKTNSDLGKFLIWANVESVETIQACDFNKVLSALKAKVEK